MIKLLNIPVNIVPQRKNNETNALNYRFSPVEDTFVRTTKSNPSFEGLTKSLSSKAFVSDQDIRLEMKKYPSSKGIVGSIPSDWVEKIPKEERADKIKQFYRYMGVLVSMFRDIGQSDALVKEYANAMTDLMQGLGLISEDKTVSLKRLDSGQYGTSYLFDCGEKYVLKVFHDVNIHSNFHGNYIETNRAAYWNKQAGRQTNRAEFYFSDLKNGYMFKSYIDKNSKKPQNIINSEIYGLEALDESGEHNIINGHSFDYGGMAISSMILATNKTARYVYKKINNTKPDLRIKVFREIVDNKNCPNYNDRLLGLIAGMEIIKEKYTFEMIESLAKADNKTVKTLLNQYIDDMPPNKRQAAKELLE